MTAAAAMAGIVVPNSSGTHAPATAVPAGACDAHIHIYDDRFAQAPGPRLTPTPTQADVAAYRLLQRRLGTQRVVIVTPRVYGTDNAVTLDAIAQFGLAHARGVAVVGPDVTTQTLQQLHDGGVRGVRFTLHAATGAPLRIEMLRDVAARIADFGWHLQLHFTSSQYLEHRDLLQSLPVPLVIDHLGRLAPEHGIDDPAFEMIAGWLQRGKAWLKLSGAYLHSGRGAPYDDTRDIARAWVAAVPDRLVWGSDWPHATEPANKPDDAQLLDLLADWAPDAQTRQKILVDNPAVLYQF